MTQSPQQSNRFFYIALAAVHILFLLLTLHYRNLYNGDSAEYIHAARNLLSNGVFYSGDLTQPLDPEQLTFRTPGYPAFLAAVYALHAHDWTVIVLQYLLSAGNILLLRRILMSFGYTARYDPLLLLLTLSYPAQFMHAGIIEPEILLQSTVLLYILQLLAFYRTRQPRHAWLAGFALTAALLVKPVLYPYTILHAALILLLIFRGQDRRMPRLRPAIAAVLPVCAILAYNGWNASRTGKFHFTSNQAFNAIYYFYFYKSSTEGVPAAQEFLRAERAHMAALPSFAERYDYANRRGKELLKASMPGYALYHLKHSLRFFVDPGKGDMDLYTGGLSYADLYQAQGKDFYSVIRREGWLAGSRQFAAQNPSVPVAAVIFLCNLVRLAGLFLFLRSREIPRAIRWFVFLFLAYFALLTGPISTPRYVLPVSLIYTGAAALGFIHLHRKRTAVVPAVR